jgi:hypothetical protein
MAPAPGKGDLMAARQRAGADGIIVEVHPNPDRACRTEPEPFPSSLQLMAALRLIAGAIDGTCPAGSELGVA